jgi:hypothetical protein
MPIDRSGPTSSLIAALRADITRRSERNKRQVSGEDADPRDTAALRRELVDIVHAAPGNDPQADDAIQRRVIEAVLRWEFGAKGTDETANPMIEQIARTLQADPQNGERFARLVRELQQR